MSVETIKVRGLARIASLIFALCGVAVSAKAIYDLFWGEPEANLYAPEKWAFVTQAQWLRYAGFELCYGLACLGLAWTVWSYARFLPEVLSRPRREPEFDLFS
ncbi:MAG: hypothetical protein ACREKE_09260 [bacterium]